MQNIPEHPLSYRQEILSRFFGYVQSAESFYLMGAASMGKTRLMDYLMRSDVIHHYLGVLADKTWLVRVDMNRLVDREQQWCFYELALSSLLLECNNHEVADEVKIELARLDSEVITGQSLLKSLRFLEMAVNKLCQLHDIKICFLFDEFDETYSKAPRDIFAHLRAMRDANKTRLTYILFLRNAPETLRIPMDNESFYELISRSALGIGPYAQADSLQMIQQLESRRDLSLPPEKREKVFIASGGHPGLIVAMISLLIDNSAALGKLNNANWLDWFSAQPTLSEESRKIWEGLTEEEQKGIRLFVHGKRDDILPLIRKTLAVKGLLQKNATDYEVFSPVFKKFAMTK